MIKKNLKKIFFVFIGLVLVLISMNFISAVNCMQYTSSSTCTTSNGCVWKNDSWGGWCNELNCWSLSTNTECTTTNVPGKNCTWQGGGTTYACEKLTCWSLSATGESSCVNNSNGLSCQWNNFCYNTGASSVPANCWSYTNQSACLNVSSCGWGQCMDKGCGSYTTAGSCAAAKDWSGRNCTWQGGSYCSENGCWRYSNSSACGNATGINCQWKWNSCNDMNCYTWDFTNETNCVNNSINLSCQWSNGYCQKKDCWSYSTQATCQNQSSCNWKAFTSTGWCNEVNCWSWDSMNGGNETSCANNSYGLSCSWSGNPTGNFTNGWCWKNMNTASCSNFTTERSCMDTYYCWWQYTNWNNLTAGGTCNNPGSFGGTTTNTTILNDWNPGCYIFDMNLTDCNNIIGCNHTGVCGLISGHSNENEINTNGINCTMINSSGLCNNIPMLSSCCSWQNGSCSTNKLSSSCRDQMTSPPVGASFCEDYNSYENEALCNQIAGNPWYMPCKWNNSTKRCGFKATDVFGNESQSIVKITNKKNCESAGGKWITENYCEGNISLPSGRCEYKFDEEGNCDKACFACEIKTSDGVSVNATNAESACQGSKLGSCEFTANTNAPNGVGYCKSKSQFKNGLAGNCDTNCGDCTYKGDSRNNDTAKRPAYYCSASIANSDGGGCKWMNDNSTTTGGYCVKKGEKTCQDSCDRCNSESDCKNLGRTEVSNQTGSCKWQGGVCVSNTGEDVEVCWDGDDDNANGLVDCADPGCYADSYCGLVSGSCFGWTDNSSCINNGCEWVIDKWGSWCDFKGSQCWKYNQNESSCTGAVIIINETLNISSARMVDNTINTSKTFTLLNLGTGWVLGSVNITNSSGTSLVGNYSVNYTTQRITFVNNTFMVSQGGLTNLTNVSYQYYLSIAQTNCKWSNGAGNGWCEQDWSRSEICMGLGQSACMALNTSGCNWTVDTWCSGTGNGTSWCTDHSGWCDYELFKPKNCWSYSSGSTECNNNTGCNWKTDSYIAPHCEINQSGKCWQYTSNSSCSADSNCIWDVPAGGGGWCMNKMEKCSSYVQADCASALGGSRCFWDSWRNMCQSSCWNGSLISSSCSQISGCVWKEQGGWCEENSMASCSNMSLSNNQTLCGGTSGCRWKNPGWCDPKTGGFSSASTAAGGGAGSAIGGDCYKYDGNQSLCTNKSLINISCGWAAESTPRCEVNWGTNCWQYTSAQAGCNSTNNCWFKNNSFGSSCMNIMDQCWNNQSFQSMSGDANWAIYCNATEVCTTNGWGGCEPKCSAQNSTTCTAGNLAGKCKWISGWCNPAGMNNMFDGMEAGAPTPLGFDNCSEGIQSSVDICGFGMKDMGNAFGFGLFVKDFSNASVCNKEKLSSFVMGMGEGGGAGMIGGGPGGPPGGGTVFGQEKTGSGNDTIVYLVYLDTDGSITGGCALTHNSSSSGYEFRFKYTSQWNSSVSKAVESFNAYKCDNSDWKATDIKLSAWKKLMCSEIGGPMIAVEKTDLTRFPTLYNSTRDMRVYVATIGNTGNISSPLDSAGPGWTTPGSVDFDIVSAFSYGADSAKFEDILKKGFVQGEDCFNSIDDDSDSKTDCNDWKCQYSPKCSGTGINAAGYVDTSTPQVTGVKIEEYPDAALVMYDTNKPTNGTLELYAYGDSRCLNKSNLIYDIGILKNNTVRQYKMWHTALIYDDNSTAANISLNWPLANGTSYYYKLKVCDSAAKCAVSKCSSIKTPASQQKCGYCTFVTRIKAPSGWNVSYDKERDGTYEHLQGYVCGPNAGMKTNYTDGRKINLRISKSDGSTYIEFLNISLTKTGLNDKVRTISTSGDMISDSSKVGLTSETRDKIINNLHPEACRIKIPVVSGATCNILYHCDDSGNNCVDRTTAAGGAPIDAANCVWNVPFCEFSTYKTSDAAGSSSSSSGGGGGGGGSKVGGLTYTITESQLNEGYSQNLGKGDKIKFSVSGEIHSVVVDSVTSSSMLINISSELQQATLNIGDEKKFDVTGDGTYDLSVKLNSINATSLKASVTIKGISEKIPEAPAEPTPGEGAPSAPVTEPSEGGAQEGGMPEAKNLIWLWVLIGLIAAAVIVVIVYFVLLRRRKR